MPLQPKAGLPGGPAKQTNKQNKHQLHNQENKSELIKHKIYKKLKKIGNYITPMAKETEVAL